MTLVGRRGKGRRELKLPATKRTDVGSDFVEPDGGGGGGGEGEGEVCPSEADKSPGGRCSVSSQRASLAKLS